MDRQSGQGGSMQVVAKRSALQAVGRPSGARSRKPPLWNQIRMFASFGSSLHGLLRTPPTRADGEEQIARDLRTREANFIRMLRLGVYARPASPYRKLLDHAGISLDDVERAVTMTGLEATLQTLFAA